MEGSSRSSLALLGHALAASEKMPAAYFGSEHGEYFTGYSRPGRLEADIDTLEVYGIIPKSISGTFYRVVPEPAYPPYFKDEIWINGDGMISAFRIQDGHADLKQRYVQTEVLQACRKERKALLGRYRNPYTDQAVFKNRSVANVSVIPYRGKILVTKEDSLAYAMDPRTLETFGEYDFEGQWEGKTFTAHPKYDPLTRELVAFGYEAKGLMSEDNYYGSLDQHGRLTEQVWFKAPYCGFQHEMAITENYVLFPIVPAKGNLERLKKGGEHWAWSSKECNYIGVLPRRGASEKDIKWFKGKNHFTAHVANSWEEDGKIVLVLTHAEGNAFYWPPEDNEEEIPQLGTVPANLSKYIIDPNATDLILPKPIPVLDQICEFHKIDERFQGQKNRYVFGCTTKGVIDWEFLKPRWGGGYAPFNAIYMLDMETGKAKLWAMGDRMIAQEPCFCPRTPEAPEGDGYLIFLVCDFEEMIGKLVIMDTQNMEEPDAIIRLPFAARFGVHGWWVDDSDIDMHVMPLKAPGRK